MPFREGCIPFSCSSIDALLTRLACKPSRSTNDAKEDGDSSRRLVTRSVQPGPGVSASFRRLPTAATRPQQHLSLRTPGELSKQLRFSPVFLRQPVCCLLLCSQSLHSSECDSERVHGGRDGAVPDPKCLHTHSCPWELVWWTPRLATARA
jgi:hypothetical protein